MADTTAISWTDHTFNPWRGCTKVSPACDHCYAEALTKRTGLDLWGKGAERRRTSPAYWRKPLQWDRMAAEDGRPHLVFCASLADVFEPRYDLDPIREDLWDLIAATPHLVWQLLTKRPEQVARLAPFGWTADRGGWPPNVWIGTTVEDQQRANLRVDRLLSLPAPVRFLSCEPLLGHVDLAPWIDRVETTGVVRQALRDAHRSTVLYPSDIGWVIAGGESGPGHRTLDLDHARDLRTMCDLADIPFLFKQVGGQFPTSGGDHLDGRTHHAFPVEAGNRDDGGPWAVRQRAKAQAVEVRRG